MKKVKIALVNPYLGNILLSTVPDFLETNRGHFPPLGLLYLYSAIKRSGHEPFFFDADLEGWTHQETAQHILKKNPDIVGLTATTFTIFDAWALAKEIKKISPLTKVLIGGPHATIYPKETVMLDGVDFAIEGEGEKVIVDLLNNLFNNNGIVSIPGITQNIGGKINHMESEGLLSSLDDLTFPARYASDYKRYSSILAKRNPITVMMTSRGCPFNCVFCNRMGRKYRYHSAEYVLSEISEIVNLGIKEIFIHDDTFTLNKKRVVDICKGIIEKGWDITWEARTRVDCVDYEMMTLMKQAGCHRLSFGVESGSSRVLKSIRKEIDLERVKEVFNICRKLKIISLADFMVGNLNETYDDIKKTFRLVKEIKPDYVQYSVCSPYPNTPLYELGLRTGVIKEDIWLQYAKEPVRDFKAPVWTQNFTETELFDIVKKAYKQFYLSSDFIFKQIKRIKSLKQLKMQAKAAFGMFFQNKC
ncbi:MAG: radical SAM protein [Candidatus Omnitrophica bacterium]|nr:radical SAM protein [Candidatus Omnitrophota bacterium]